MIEGYQFSFPFLSRLGNWTPKMFPNIHYNESLERVLSPRYSLVKIPESIQIFLYDKSLGEIVASTEIYGGAAIHEPGARDINALNPFITPYSLSVEAKILVATKNGSTRRFVVPGYSIESSALAPSDTIKMIERKAKSLRDGINGLDISTALASPDPIPNCKLCAQGGRSHIITHILRGEVNPSILHKFTGLVTPEGQMMDSPERIRDVLFDVLYSFAVPRAIGITVWVINDDPAVKRVVNRVRGL